MKHLKVFESWLTQYENGPLARLRLLFDYYKDRPEVAKKELDLMRARYGEYVSDLDQKIKNKEVEINGLKDVRDRMKKDYFYILKKYRDNGIY